MTEPAPRRRISAEDIAIPELDLVELIEGLVDAAAALRPDEPIDAGPKQRAATGAPRGGEQVST
jgi:hypothetical protein